MLLSLLFLFIDCLCVRGTQGTRGAQSCGPHCQALERQRQEGHPRVWTWVGSQAALKPCWSIATQVPQAFPAVSGCEVDAGA